jgi:hypothetical protein
MNVLKLTSNEKFCKGLKPRYNQYKIFSEVITIQDVPDFGRVFLMLKYADITQNTYVRSSTVTEITGGEI